VQSPGTGVDSVAVIVQGSLVGERLDATRTVL